MKKAKATMLILALIFSINSFAQQECKELLQGGLYSFTSMTNTGSFSQDLRTYFLSEDFKKHVKSGKWGGSVTIPIEGSPISLGMDYSDDKYNEFRSKVLATTEFSISENFYQTSFSSIPNTNLYDAYVECVKINNDVSKIGFIQGVNIETEDIVVFNFYYRPQAPGDGMPVVTSFNVQPVESVISGGLTTGQTLNSFSYVVTCKRDPEKDLVLSLQTNKATFSSKSSAEGSFSSSKELPLGTVVTSVLNYEQFSFATKNNEKSPGGVWTSAKSRWAPCDGRSIPNSKYGKLASQTNAPDLRGVFLRGLNSFDPNHTINPSNPNQLNSSPTPVGVYQPDAVGNHTHQIASTENDLGNGGDKNYSLEGDIPGMSGYTSGYKTWRCNDCQAETRPKNVSIYYYIKIN